MNLITILIAMLFVISGFFILVKYFANLNKPSVKQEGIRLKLDANHFNQIRTMFQQDDIKDAEINPIKQKHRYVSMQHRKAVFATNKSQAILLFKERYNLIVTRKDIK